MMITLNDLLNRWNQTSPYSNGFLQISEGHPLSVHVGYEGDQRCFIILDTDRIEKIDSSKAITVACIEYSQDKYGLKFLLKYNALDDLFVKLCWDLLNISQESANPIQAVFDRYKSWLLLLQKHREGILSSSRQKGLIAELLFLLEQSESIGVEKALSAWVGPEGSDQDYIFENCWYEVKATAKESISVRISSLQQLDRTDYGEMIVYFMDKVSASGSGTISLTEIVENAFDIMPSQSLKDRLECKLAMYGYYSHHASYYRDTYYVCTEKREYKVINGFPKLTVNNVPHEIVEAKYSIDLASIDSFKK